MPFIDSKFSNTDNELANFAKALALPVRVAIIRLIIANGNSITKENFHTIPFNHETINKHIAELKNLGIIKATGYKGNIKYGVDDCLFSQMANRFAVLFSGTNNWAANLED
ncbi:ArsR/SmtB family transcription factor [Mucilaginibacter sp. FT3.2]|uniref:ArsR/SmtB family transcription factor n=1 Tax=Mucilaginibacter sp. FT3.2 TaxID=2723090 RepID=UPI00160FEA38|nr:helix-turn-helix transcriptional regulator [Mucilaginibacter sp. FT3.2]MBB6235086.1 putative transcriptional regulator [Mucilaginibacter sp. FT3.2]